jgi:hypothetical protein
MLLTVINAAIFCGVTPAETLKDSSYDAKIAGWHLLKKRGSRRDLRFCIKGTV